MFKGSLRLRVDKWGSVEVAEDLGFQPNVRPGARLQRSMALHAAPLSSGLACSAVICSIQGGIRAVTASLVCYGRPDAAVPWL